MRILTTAGLLLFAGFAQAENCVIDLKSDDAMKFDQASVTVSASCKSIEIKLAHTGKMPVAAMGHNVVITTTPDFMPVAQDGMKAGLPANYLKAGDTRVITNTQFVGGGESTSVKFDGAKLKAGGDYTFFCSFPGHWAIMKGKVVVE